MESAYPDRAAPGPADPPGSSLRVRLAEARAAASTVDAATVARQDELRERVAEYRRHLAEVTGVLGSAGAGEHTGGDEEGAVTARLDGRGRVLEVALGYAAARLDAASLGAAVLAALRQADRRRTEVLLDVAARLGGPR